MNNLLSHLTDRLSSGNGKIARTGCLLTGICWMVYGAVAIAGPSGPDADTELHRSPVAGSPIPAISAHTVFRAPADSVFRVISDYAHFPDFIPMVAESRVVDGDARTMTVYQRLDLPFPALDRHYVIDIINNLHAAPTGIIDVAWSLDTLRTQALPSSRAVAPVAFSGSWHLVPVDRNAGCDAIYTIHVDPGGALPDWLFVRLTERYVMQVIGAVRKRLATGGQYP